MADLEDPDAIVRLAFDGKAEVRQALKAEAAKRGMEMGELAELILREALRDMIAEVRRHFRSGKKRDS